LSAEGVRRNPHDYAVVWRTGDGPTSSGRLELGDHALVLHGSGGPDGLRIPFDELSSVEIGRAQANGSTATNPSFSSGTPASAC
jgi:hypothetical protein